MNSKPTICLELDNELLRGILRDNLEADGYELEQDPNKADVILEEVEERFQQSRKTILRLRRPGCSGENAPRLAIPFRYESLLELLRGLEAIDNSAPAVEARRAMFAGFGWPTTEAGR